MSELSNLTDSRAPAVLSVRTSYDPISDEAFQRFSLVSQCVVKPPILLVGISSNVVNCVVFWRQGLGDRMNFCLFCLALADLLYLLSLLAMTQIGPFVELADVLLGKEVYAKSIRFGLGIRDEMRTIAGCINLVIAVERCVCVYLPLRAATLMKTRSMVGLLASIYIVTQLGFVNSYFHYEAVEKRSNITDQTVYWGLEPSLTAKHNYVLFRGFDLLLLIILPTCIFVSMCIATAATVAKLRAAMLWRQKTSSSRNDSQQTALIKMLVVVSCVYIVTSTPYVALILTSAFVADFDAGGRYQNSFLTLGVIAIICSATNCSFNFVIYYRHSSRYRLEIKALCCCIAPKVT